MKPQDWYDDLRNTALITYNQDPGAIVPLAICDLLDLFGEIESLKDQRDRVHQALEEFEAEAPF